MGLDRRHLSAVNNRTFLVSVSTIGVAFSGGIDSGAVFLVTYHVMRQLGLSPARLRRSR